ncbi:pyridoxine 5'-phosphate synthase [Rubrivirga marina]|uniref:Pyridoxine 5'-phosphate synthase n=1 Tax=Rubrivirga marina TaxID=1196024 RepID=A0A271J4L7_9BACT|nr:pyridoxine 5'-phosphate synthase [Rubrivirga marina]PAP78452.1 pyridoxine 5'-phosphate synthase [Rubrivirga marina]
MTRLSVNFNKAALMRNARTGSTGAGRPNVGRLARVAVGAGAVGATLHPRPDGRHALAADVETLRALMGRGAPLDGAELNVEGNPFEGPARHGDYDFPGFMEILRAARPTQATLVPDAAGQRTSDHGWDFARDGARLGPLVEELRGLGCRVSLFVDPDPEAVRAAADVGADRVELYTGPYAWAHTAGDASALLDRHRAAAEAAAEAGLTVNAGHDLDLENLGPYLRAVPGVAEVSIGQALLADALLMGLEGAVRAYLKVLAEAGE